MPFVFFGKGKGSSDKPAYPCPDGCIKPFNVESKVFPYFVLFGRYDAPVGFPVIGLEAAAF